MSAPVLVFTNRHQKPRPALSRFVRRAMRLERKAPDGRWLAEVLIDGLLNRAPTEASVRLEFGSTHQVFALEIEGGAR